MSNATQKKRKSIWIMDKGKCFYCATPIGYGSKKFTLDHVIPRSKGGETATWNLVTCCKKCNQEKDDVLPSEKYLDAINKRRRLVETCVRLGKAFREVKESGNFKMAEHLLAIKSVLNFVLYGRGIKNIDKYSEEFVFTFSKMLTDFTSLVIADDPVERVGEQLLAVEILLTEATGMPILPENF